MRSGPISLSSPVRSSPSGGKRQPLLSCPSALHLKAYPLPPPTPFPPAGHTPVGIPHIRVSKIHRQRAHSILAKDVQQRKNPKYPPSPPTTPSPLLNAGCVESLVRSKMIVQVALSTMFTVLALCSLKAGEIDYRVKAIEEHRSKIGGELGNVELWAFAMPIADTPRYTRLLWMAETGEVLAVDELAVFLKMPIPTRFLLVIRVGFTRQRLP